VPTLSPKAGEKGRAPTGKSDAKSQTERAGHPPAYHLAQCRNFLPQLAFADDEAALPGER